MVRFRRKSQRQLTMNLALGRFISFEENTKIHYLKSAFDVHTFYADVIGVTKMPNQRAERFEFEMPRQDAQYVIAKPIHSSQKILQENLKEIHFSIRVIWNQELEREILGFGIQLVMISPSKMIKRMRFLLGEALENY